MRTRLLFGCMVAGSIFFAGLPSSSHAQADRQGAEDALLREIHEFIVKHERVSGLSGGDPRVVRGDLDGDGDLDAAALYTMEGPIGFLHFLLALLQEDGVWFPADNALAGVGKWREGDLREIVNREIVLSIQEHAQGDDPCCPSLTVEGRYRLKSILPGLYVLDQSRPSGDTVARLRLGMSGQQVLDLLGRPRTRVELENGERWTYEFDDSRGQSEGTVIHFGRRGTVVRIDQR